MKKLILIICAALLLPSAVMGQSKEIKAIFDKYEKNDNVELVSISPGMMMFANAFADDKESKEWTSKITELRILTVPSSVMENNVPLRTTLKRDMEGIITKFAMPHIPREIFLTAVNEVVAYSANFIPRRSGESLYIRPFMFASEETLGIKPSEKFKFMVIASPSASYFGAASNALSVLIERDSARAFPGGTGFAKAGGNYAASLLSAIKAKNLGFVQTLWLDGKEKTYIEEMSIKYRHTLIYLLDIFFIF